MKSLNRGIPAGSRHGGWFLSGFTLIELLTVMAIMMLLTTVGVIGYVATTRGIAVKSAVHHLTQMLNFARQTSIMQGRKTYVIFSQDGTNAWYSVCREEGVIHTSGGALYDEYRDWAGTISAGLVIYCLDTGKTGTVTQVHLSDDNASSWMFVEPQDVLGNNSTYGWAVCPKTSLPRGYLFGDGSDAQTPSTIVYHPEGKVSFLTGGGSDLVIQIVEARKKKDSSAKRAVITVKSLTGFVSVELSK